MGTPATLVSLLVTLLLVKTGAEDCDPPIENCSCQSQTLMCKNLDKFPTSVPDTITELIIDLCLPNFNDLTIPKLNYPSVTKLLVRSCDLERITSGAFLNMTQLTTLDLTGNKIAPIRSEDFEGLSGLLDLSLSANGVSNLIDGVFSDMPNLSKLNLNGNRALSLAAGSFRGLETSLKELYLEQTGLHEFPVSSLSILTSLIKLDLNNNQISAIPDGTFDGLSSLEDLSLDKCSLAADSISSNTFSNLGALKSLNLGFNEIHSIPQGAFNSFKDTITALYLEHNQITTLSEYLINWDNLKMLNLSNNPWDCDCSIYWMKNVDFSLLNDGFSTNVTCTTPEEYQGHNLHNVTSQLAGCDGGDASVVALAITIPIIIICAGFIGYYLFKIIQARRKRDQRKAVRYSAVYKDTVESTQKPPRPPRPVSEL